MLLMKLLFLDIDGVITTHKSNYCLDPEKMELLGQILGRTGALIVISSSWRQTTLYDTKKALVDYDNPQVKGNPFLFTERVIGITPVLIIKNKYGGEWDGPASRGEEIEAYLKDHPCENYVILDDDTEMLPEQTAHFVHVNDEFGLMPTDVEKCVSILNADDDH